MYLSTLNEKFDKNLDTIISKGLSEEIGESGEITREILDSLADETSVDWTPQIKSINLSKPAEEKVEEPKTEASDLEKGVLDILGEYSGIEQGQEEAEAEEVEEQAEAPEFLPETNLFIKTLREEYGSSAQVENIIKLLYLTPRELTKSEFKQLNSDIYDLVIDIIKNNKTLNIMVSEEIQDPRNPVTGKFGIRVNSPIDNTSHSIDDIYDTYDANFNASSTDYTFHMYDYGNTLHISAGPKLQISGWSNLTCFMDDFLSRYNAHHFAEDQIEHDLFEQLGEVDPDLDKYNIRVLREDTNSFLEGLHYAIADMQQRMAVEWIGCPVSTGFLDRYPVGDYSVDHTDLYEDSKITTDFVDEIYKSKKPEDLFMEGGRSAEFFSKYFHRETALEDIIRLAILMRGDNIGDDRENVVTLYLPCDRNMDSIMEDAGKVMCGLPHDNRFKIPECSLKKIVKSIIDPVEFVKVGGLSLIGFRSDTDKAIEDGDSAAASIIRALLKCNMNTFIGYQMFFCKTGEMMESLMSSVFAEELVDMLKNHPAYKKLLELEEDESKEEEDPIPFHAFINNRNELLNREQFYSMMQVKIREVFRIANATKTALTAIMHVLNLVSHKLWPKAARTMTSQLELGLKDVGIVAGLSSALIHLVSYSEKLTFLTAVPATFLFSKINPDIFTKTSELRYLADEIGGKNKPAAFIQDACEFVITSGAYIVFDMIRARHLQSYFKDTRDTLTQDMFVVSTTRPLSAFEMNAVMEEGNAIGRSTGKAGKIPAIIKNNLIERVWPKLNPRHADMLGTQLYRYTSYEKSMLGAHPEEYGTTRPASYNTRLHFERPVFRCQKTIGSGFQIPMGGYVLSVVRSYASRATGGMDPLRMFMHRFIGMSPSKDDDNHKLYVVEGQSTGTGYAYASDMTGAPMTIWNSRFMKRLKMEDKQHRIFGPGCKIAASLVVPLVYNKWEYGVTSVPNSEPYKGSLGFVISFLSTDKIKFNMDDILSCAWDVVKIDNTDDKEKKSLESITALSTDVVFNKMDWRSVLTARENNTSRVPTFRQLNGELLNISRGSRTRKVSLMEWNKIYAYGLNPSLWVDMITNDDGTDVTFMSGPEYTSLEAFCARSVLIYKRAMLMKDVMVYKKDTPEEVHVDNLSGEEIDRDGRGADIFSQKVCMYLEDKSTPEYRSMSEGKQGLADDLSGRYCSFMIRGKKSALESRQKEVGSLYAKYKEMMKKLEDLKAEIEDIENGTNDSGPFSSKNALRNLVNDGTILDFSPSRNDDVINVVISAPRIWVGGYIYIMSPGIVRIPFDVRNANSSICVKAVKDLATMQVEALQLLGRKYDLEGLGELYDSNDAFSNISPSLSNEVYDYPHVHSGRGCMGSYSTELSKAIQTGDISRYIKTVKEYIKSVTITDGYGKGIIGWPAIPATMFNLLKHGLLGAMDVTLDARIVIPGKKLIKSSKVNDTKYPVDLMPAAMIDVRDISSEMLQYLLEEAESIKEDNDFAYMHSFGPGYTKYISTAFVSPTIYGGGSLSSLYKNDQLFNRARKCQDMMMEYAYLTQGPGADPRAQKASLDIVEAGIQNIKTFRESIRKCPPGGDHFTNREWHRSFVVEPISLKGDTVLVGSFEEAKKPEVKEKSEGLTELPWE